MSTTTVKSSLQFQRDYHTLGLLGKGGYGSVYLATDASGTKVAVKVISDERCLNRGWCSRRQQSIPNEILLWEGVTHHNTHQLLDVYFDDKSARWYLVMEYDPDYQDLFNYIDRNGAMSTREAAAVIRQLVSLSYHLTLMGIEHRDIKDENILYNPRTEHIKVIDFGSAAELSPDPYTLFRGTDVYIPPEYFCYGKYHSLPATVWAIGCLSFILLDGDCPFESRDDVMGFKSVDELRSDFVTSDERHNFIRTCLNPDPGARISYSDLLKHPWLNM